MLPQLSTVSTVIAFIAVIAVGTAGLLVLPVDMAQDTILMMVLPSMIVFGAIMVVIGVAHGQFRATKPS